MTASGGVRKSFKRSRQQQTPKRQKRDSLNSWYSRLVVQPSQLSSRPRTKDPAQRETEEESGSPARAVLVLRVMGWKWRDPDGVRVTMPIRGVSTCFLLRFFPSFDVSFRQPVKRARAFISTGVPSTRGSCFARDGVEGARRAEESALQVSAPAIPFAPSVRC